MSQIDLKYLSDATLADLYLMTGSDLLHSEKDYGSDRWYKAQLTHNEVKIEMKRRGYRCKPIRFPGNDFDPWKPLRKMMDFHDAHVVQYARELIADIGWCGAQFELDDLDTNWAVETIKEAEMRIDR